MDTAKTSIDLSVESDRDLMSRIAAAWRDIRRGAANNQVRQLIYEHELYSIDPGQFDVLQMLILHEAMRMGEVADMMRVDPSTATRAVQRLIRDGFAQRVAHDGDARVVMVGPTDFGREAYLHVVERRRELVVSVVEQFDESEREHVASILERFSFAVDNAVNEFVSRRR